MSNRLIVKNSMILYVRLGVTTLVGLFASRLVLGALGISDYGLYSVVGGIVTMMAFINTIMVSTTHRYIAYETGKVDGDVNKIFNISLSIHIAMALLVVVLAFSVGLFYIYNFLRVPDGRLPAAVFVFSFSIINTVCTILGTPFNGFLIAKEKFTVTVPIEISTKLLQLGLVALLIYLPVDKLKMYAIMMTLVHLLNPVMYILYCLRKFPKEVKWKFNKDFTVYREMFGFSGWIMFGAAAQVGKNQGSAVIINRFFGTIMNASFGVANQVDTMVRMFAQGMNQAVIPQITKSFSSGDHARSSRLVMNSSKYALFLMLFPSLPLLLETDFVLHTWLSNVPPYTGIFVRIILFNELINSAKSGLPALIQASGKIKWFQIITGTISLLSLPAAYIAYTLNAPVYIISFFYLVIGIVTFWITMFLLRVIINYNVYEYLRYYLSRMAIVTLSMLPLLLIQMLMPYGLMRFAITLIISEAWLVFIVLFLGMDLTERKSIARYILLVIKKLSVRFT